MAPTESPAATAAEAPVQDAGDGEAASPVAAADEPSADELPVEASANGQADSAALDDADTADAPAAGEEDEEPEPPRELGPEPTTMEELLAEQDTDIKSFKHGDVVEGQVVRIDKDELLVDVGLPARVSSATASSSDVTARVSRN